MSSTLGAESVVLRSEIPGKLDKAKSLLMNEGHTLTEVILAMLCIATILSPATLFISRTMNNDHSMRYVLVSSVLRQRMERMLETGGCPEYEARPDEFFMIECTITKDGELETYSVRATPRRFQLLREGRDLELTTTRRSFENESR